MHEPGHAQVESCNIGGPDVGGGGGRTNPSGPWRFRGHCVGVPTASQTLLGCCVLDSHRQRCAGRWRPRGMQLVPEFALIFSYVDTGQQGLRCDAILTWVAGPGPRPRPRLMQCTSSPPRGLDSARHVRSGGPSSPGDVAIFLSSYLTLVTARGDDFGSVDHRN